MLIPLFSLYEQGFGVIQHCSYMKSTPGDGV
ncbi:hypothetical protein V6Z12_D04G100500 [Gossypium hirsutum]